MKKQLLFLLTILIISCVQPREFDVPTSLGDEENQRLELLMQALDQNEKTLVSIDHVKALYVGDEAVEITADLVVKGYVVSSDETGNFFKEFYIQDHPSEPTVGIKVVVDRRELHNKYNLGREVFIDLKGLYVGETRTGDGVIAVGGVKNDDDEVEAIPEKQATEILLRGTQNTLTPIPVRLSELSDTHIGMLVAIAQANFAAAEQGAPFVDPFDSFDTQRTIESCEGLQKTEFLLETSSFADFAQMPLPATGGTIHGVVTKTFNGSDLVLVLNQYQDLMFDQEPCSLPDTIFEEDFQDIDHNTNLDLEGWTNFAEAGNRLWIEEIFGGNGYTEFSPFLSGDVANIGWLVTPPINLDNHNGAILVFQTAQHHLSSPDNTLEVFVSTDFDGTNVLSATWEPMEARLASLDDDWYDFVPSGEVDLSSYSGNLYIAFKYVGSGTNTQLDGGYFVDDVRVFGL